jgi:hypothetical protein
MNFIEWTKQHEPEGPTLAAADPRTIKTRRDRDRLIRIETMLQDLIHMNQISDRRNQPCQ